MKKTTTKIEDKEESKPTPLQQISTNTEVLQELKEIKVALWDLSTAIKNIRIIVG